MLTVATTQDTWDLLTCHTTVYGTRFWRDEVGDLHRENGPAVIYSDGEVEYWIDGEPLTEEEFNARKLTINGNTIESHH